MTVWGSRERTSHATNREHETGIRIGGDRMLILITWTSITLAVSSSAAPTPSARDTIKSRDQDTVGVQDSEFVQKKPLLRERPSFGTSSFLNNRPAEHPYPQQFAGTVDSLIRTHPEVKRRLLRELLIPSRLPGESRETSPLESFNEQLERDSKFTSFERMSLIAKRYATDHPPDRSMKSYQLDIRRTIRWWLEEVFK